MRASRNLSWSWALLPLALLAAAVLPAQANVFISAQPTSNMSCSGGVCAPTAQPANLNTTDLAHMLASSDVTVMSGSDTNRREIVVKSMFGWASSHRLTLDANYAVEIDAPIVVHGPGGVTVTYHVYPGAFSFGPGGHVAFWDLSSTFVLNGRVFTLVGDIGSLASAIAANSAGNFALAGDVKSTTVYTASPIPTTFNGVLEGLGNRILYLRINDTAANQYDGLFATIGTNGGVRDLGLVNAKVQGTSGSRIGIFAGESDGAIWQSYATGMVLHTGSAGYLGGMVGWNTGGISYSYSQVSVRGQQNVSAGGIAGYMLLDCCHNGTISGVRASGDVTAGNGSSVGGLVGTNVGGVSGSQASGAVIAGSASLAGGLVGQGRGYISYSFATGAVRVGNLGKAGGLQGRLDGDGQFTEGVTEAYAMGSVTGGQRAELGSLFGECCLTTKVLMYHAYGIGAVSGGPQSIIGGVVGHDGQQGKWIDVYWDTDATGVGNLSQGAGNVVNDPGIVGLSDAQLKSALPPGFTDWGENAAINNGYPYLLENPPQ